MICTGCIIGVVGMVLLGIEALHLSKILRSIQKTAEVQFSTVVGKAKDLEPLIASFQEKQNQINDNLNQLTESVSRLNSIGEQLDEVTGCFSELK